MVKNARKGMLLGAAGLVAGVALGAMGMMSLRGGDGPYATSPAATRSMGAASASAPAGPSTYVTALSVNCEMAPILPNGGDGDGQVNLQSRAATATGSEVAALILSGKEAAAAGRQRDAEISFLNACRNAAVLQEGDGIPLADAMYQLGRHYATVAAFGSPKAKELLPRAERLYSASLEGYRARLGPTHEKTKFAQEGLITVRQGTGTAVAGNSAPATAAAPAAPAAPAPAAMPAPAPAPAPVAAPPAPTPAPAPAPVAAATTPAPAAKPAPAPAPLAAAPTPVPAPKTAPAPVAAARPAPAPAPQAAAPAAAPPAPVATADAADKPAQPRRTSPSFNCAQARSTTEKLICGDEELARMDRELGAMHQRAREASADPRAFQRNSDVEWQRREDTCRDRECLRRWYAERRAQLSAASSNAAPAARAAAADPTKARSDAKTPTPAEQQQAPRPRRAAARTATADASPAEQAAPAPVARPARPARVAPQDQEFEAPPPRSSAMGANPGDAPTAEGSAGAAE
jgi:uncharacterized protein